MIVGVHQSQDLGKLVENSAHPKIAGLLVGREINIPFQHKNKLHRGYSLGWWFSSTRLRMANDTATPWHRCLLVQRRPPKHHWPNVWWYVSAIQLISRGPVPMSGAGTSIPGPQQNTHTHCHQYSILYVHHYYQPASQPASKETSRSVKQ